MNKGKFFSSKFTKVISTAVTILFIFNSVALPYPAGTSALRGAASRLSKGEGTLAKELRKFESGIRGRLTLLTHSVLLDIYHKYNDMEREEKDPSVVVSEESLRSTIRSAIKRMAGPDRDWLFSTRIEPDVVDALNDEVKAQIFTEAIMTFFRSIDLGEKIKDIVALNKDNAGGDRIKGIDSALSGLDIDKWVIEAEKASRSSAAGELTWPIRGSLTNMANKLLLNVYNNYELRKLNGQDPNIGFSEGSLRIQTGMIIADITAEDRERLGPTGVHEEMVVALKDNKKADLYREAIVAYFLNGIELKERVDEIVWLNKDNVGGDRIKGIDAGFKGTVIDGWIIFAEIASRSRSDGEAEAAKSASDSVVVTQAPEVAVRVDVLTPAQEIDKKIDKNLHDLAFGTSREKTTALDGLGKIAAMLKEEADMLRAKNPVIISETLEQNLARRNRIVGKLVYALYHVDPSDPDMDVCRKAVTALGKCDLSAPPKELRISVVRALNSIQASDETPYDVIKSAGLILQQAEQADKKKAPAESVPTSIVREMLLPTAKAISPVSDKPQALQVAEGNINEYLAKLADMSAVPEARQAAAYRLGETRLNSIDTNYDKNLKRITTRLIYALNDDDAGVCKEAAIALAKLGVPRELKAQAVDTLKSILYSSEQSHTVLAKVALALKRIDNAQYEAVRSGAESLLREENAFPRKRMQARRILTAYRSAENRDLFERTAARSASMAEVLNANPTNVHPDKLGSVIYLDMLVQNPAMQEELRKGGRKFYLANRSGKLAADFIAESGIDPSVVAPYEMINEEGLEIDAHAMVGMVEDRLHDDGMEQIRVFALNEEDFKAWASHVKASAKGSLETVVMLFKEKAFKIVSNLTRTQEEKIRAIFMALDKA